MREWKRIRWGGKYYIHRSGMVISYFNGEYKIITQSVRKGYYAVWLSTVPGRSVPYPVHRLVAVHFKRNPKKLPIVNHLDHNRFNNDSSNLRWSTHSQNSKHSFLHGNREPTRTCKISDADVKNIRKLFASGLHTQRTIAEMHNISQGHVSDIVLRTKRNNI